MSIGVMKEKIGIKQDVIHYLSDTIFQMDEDKYEISWKHMRSDLLVMFSNLLKEPECSKEMAIQFKQVIKDMIDEM